MSANLYWTPVNPNNKVNFSGGSTLATILTKAFGAYPVEFTEKDIPKLQGIIACGYDELEELVDVIQTHKTIEVTEEY